VAFTLIDGVIAHDAFATPATPGTSALVDGINNQQFNTPASATAQPVDAVLGLTTWAEAAGPTPDITGTGIPTGQAFGGPTITAVVSTASITTGEAIGKPAIAGQVQSTDIGTAEALGAPAVSATIAENSIPGAEALGAAAISASIQSTSIQGAEALGKPAISANIASTDIGSGEALDTRQSPRLAAER
jgi:hypothetical protein